MKTLYEVFCTVKWRIAEVDQRSTNHSLIYRRRARKRIRRKWEYKRDTKIFWLCWDWGKSPDISFFIFQVSAKLLFTSLFNFFQSLTAAKCRFYDSPFFIFGFYFAAMRIVIYEIMMYFQHKINVWVLYPLRETTNKKYLFMYFHILV